MFQPPGLKTDELGDIEIVVHEGNLHLFYLCLPNHDRIAHWVSQDGIDWEPRPDALRTGTPGSFDDDQLWTMSVTRYDDHFVMLYTALSTVDDGRVQRVARAVSGDLETWTKDPRPVAVAAGDRYETEPGRSAPWVSFRDPKPVPVSGGFATAVCAQVPSGPPHRRGAVALLRSDDLVSFSLEEPIYAPRRDFELECPQVVRTEHGFVLIASMQDDRSLRWFLADGLEGPFRTPPNNRLLPASYYAGRIFEHEGELAIAATYRYDDRDGRRHHVMPAPLRLDFESPQRLRLRPWKPARARFSSSSEPFAPKTPCLGNQTASREGDALVVLAGEELWCGPSNHRHAMINGTVRCDGPRYGLAFDVSPDGAGWFVEFEPASHRVRLVRRGPGQLHGQPWFEREVAQSRVWPDASDGPQRVGLRLAGRVVELVVAGEVLLSAAVDRTSTKPGKLGVWADSGRLRPSLHLHRIASA